MYRFYRYWKDHYHPLSHCNRRQRTLNFSCFVLLNGRYSRIRRITPHLSKLTLFCGISLVNFFDPSVICPSQRQLSPFPPGTGRVQAAQTLLDVLPPELAGISEPEERATEYLHYRQFFVIWETVERVVDCQSQHVPGMNKDAKATWLDDYRVCLFSEIQMLLVLMRFLAESG